MRSSWHVAESLTNQRRPKERAGDECVKRAPDPRKQETWPPTIAEQSIGFLFTSLSHRPKCYGGWGNFFAHFQLYYTIQYGSTHACSAVNVFHTFTNLALCKKTPKSTMHDIERNARNWRVLIFNFWTRKIISTQCLKSECRFEKYLLVEVLPFDQ